MPKVSVIIAARNERHLPRMIDHLFTRLTGDFEILVGIDGPPYLPSLELPIDDRLLLFRFEQRGLKPTINHLAKLAAGEYLLKLDSHCAVSEGIDEVLPQYCGPCDMLVPRFYTLDETTWEPHPTKRHNDYWNVSCPLTDSRGYRFQAGGYWFERTIQRSHIGPTDETMTHHGSCWLTPRRFFLDDLGGMQSQGYGVNYMEPADLGFRTWLGPWGGRVLCVKTCWYSHLHQNHRERGYPVDWPEVRRSYDWTANYWMRNAWPGAAHKLEWLIDRFWPIPTWPDNWRELQAEYERSHKWSLA